MWTLQDALPLYLQGSRLIVLSGATRRGTEGGRLQSYDWHTQTAQWSQPLGGTLKSWGALYGAIVSGERLYLSFVYTPLLPRTGEAGMAVGALKAWNARNGKPVAQAISGVEEWGFGPPACDGKMVYQGLSHHLDARDADTLTAHTWWSDGGNAYPIVAGRQLIIKGWMGSMQSWNLDTHKQNWLSGGPREMRHCLVKDSQGRERLIESSSALDAATGKTVWKCAPSVQGVCVIGAGRLVYMAGARPRGADDRVTGGFYAFDVDTGKLRWKYEQPGLWGTNIIVAQGRVYASSGDGNMYCFAPLHARSARNTASAQKMKRGVLAQKMEPVVLTPRQIYHPEPQYKTGGRNNSSSEQTGYRDVAVTPRVVIIGAYRRGREGVVAFERGTGRELWRRERTEEAGEGDTSRILSNVPDVRPDGGVKGGFGTAPSANAGPQAALKSAAVAAWQYFGTAARQDGSGVVVLKALLPIRNAEERYAGPEEELHGVEAETGRELWQASFAGARREDKPQMVGVYGSVIALAYAEAAYNAKTQRWEPREKGSHAGFLDAFTGQPMASDTPQAKAALKRACVQHGSPLVLFETGPQWPRLLHLDTGIVQSPSKPTGGYANVLGVTVARGVVLVNMDDDFAGHSVWPRYIYGVDGKGGTAWQFPNHLLLPGVDFDLATGKGFTAEKGQIGHDFEDVEQAQVIADSGTVLAISRTPYQAQQRNLTGMQAADGRVLWRKPAGEITILRPWKQGCFALMKSGRLTYIDARTGQQQSCGRLPACDNFLIAGEDLFTVHSDGTVAAYNMPHLTPSVPAPRAYPVTPRRKKKR